MTHLPDSEKAVDQVIKKMVKEKKGLYIKLDPKFFKGIPDRMALLPEGEVRFLELKSKGKDPSPMQSVVCAVLRHLGFKVMVVSGGDTLSEVIDFLK